MILTNGRHFFKTIRWNHFTKIVCTMYARAKVMCPNVFVRFSLHMQMSVQGKVKSLIGDILWISVVSYQESTFMHFSKVSRKRKNRNNFFNERIAKMWKIDKKYIFIFRPILIFLGF